MKTIQGVTSFKFNFLLMSFICFVSAVHAADRTIVPARFSCEEFEQILNFVDSEHLRLREENPASIQQIRQAAIHEIPARLRELGYIFLADRFNQKLVPNFTENQNLPAKLLCEKLEHPLFRLGYVKAYVKQLDPFSNFLLTEEVEKRTSVVSGHFVGVGIGTDAKDDGLEITEVIEEGPAHGKIFLGDLIQKIDGQSVRLMPQEEVRRRIRGSLDTWVEFQGLRKTGESFVVNVQRGHVFQKSVSHEWKENNILQIKIHRFFAQTADQIESLIKANSSRLQGIILDLRDNPGGLLHAARDVVDLFIDQGVVVYLRGLYSDEMWALNAGGYTRLPLVVLVNERTASAAEIVAGALQDYKRALIVGRKTFGKSCVQNIYETQGVLGTKYLGNLKLTTLWYYLPSGKSVRSMKPDYLIEDPVGESVDRLKMPFEQPEQIAVMPLFGGFSNQFERFLKKRSDETSLTGSSDRAEEIGRAIMREMQALVDR